MVKWKFIAFKTVFRILLRAPTVCATGEVHYTYKYDSINSIMLRLQMNNDEVMILIQYRHSVAFEENATLIQLTFNSAVSIHLQIYFT